MRILADESLDAGAVVFQRSLGHDVEYVCELAPSESDAAILALAWEKRRIVITNDLDFGELVVRRGGEAHGVLLLRFDAKNGAEYLNLFRVIWPRVEARIAGHFVVATNNLIRARKL